VVRQHGAVESLLQRHAELGAPLGEAVAGGAGAVLAVVDAADGRHEDLARRLDAADGLVMVGVPVAVAVLDLLDGVVAILEVVEPARVEAIALDLAAGGEREESGGDSSHGPGHNYAFIAGLCGRRKERCSRAAGEVRSRPSRG